MPQDTENKINFNVMEFKSKVVTKIPLTELWTDEGPIDAMRGRKITASDIKEILTEVIFVVADIGQKINWIKRGETYDFWKSDLRIHLWDHGVKLDLDKFPDGYAYLATEWTDKEERRIVLLEKFH